ncbi:FecR family protein [Prolixibacteraceae bacterium JC049]|nr:FecR family protein [Prolixibacteraceae bacterium JC049]
MEILQVIRFISGRMTSAEKVDVLNDIDLDDEAAVAEYAALKNSWELNTLEKGLSPNTINRNLKAVDQKIAKRTNRRMVKLWHKSAKYAAALVAAFVMGFWINSHLSQEHDNVLISTVTVPMGQMAQVMLPDSSQVWLNSGSTISYPAAFHKSNRRVSISGEAFLKVKTNKSQPFWIDNPMMNIMVTGTEFNFRAYPDEKEASATLVEGRIMAEVPYLKRSKQIVPGQMISYEKGAKKWVLKKVDTEMYSSWKDGYVVLKNKPLGEFFKMIERWYDVEVVLENEAVAKQLYGGTLLKNKQLEQVFEVLQITSGIHYEIKEKDNKRIVIIK